MYSHACLLALSVLAPISWQPQDRPPWPPSLYPPLESVLPVLERAAEGMECIDMNAVLYDRLPCTYASRDFEERFQAAWRPVFDRKEIRESYGGSLGGKEDLRARWLERMRATTGAWAG